MIHTIEQIVGRTWHFLFCFITDDAQRTVLDSTDNRTHTSMPALDVVFSFNQRFLCRTEYTASSSIASLLNTRYLGTQLYNRPDCLLKYLGTYLGKYGVRPEAGLLDTT